jgi:hypothetical protein
MGSTHYIHISTKQEKKSKSFNLHGTEKDSNLSSIPTFLLPPFPEYIVAAGGGYGSSGHHGRDDSLWINLILGCFI